MSDIKAMKISKSNFKTGFNAKRRRRHILTNPTFSCDTMFWKICSILIDGQSTTALKKISKLKKWYYEPEYLKITFCFRNVYHYFNLHFESCHKENKMQRQKLKEIMSNVSLQIDSTFA